jgi:hypothetical protein
MPFHILPLQTSHRNQLRGLADLFMRALDAKVSSLFAIYMIYLILFIPFILVVSAAIPRISSHNIDDLRGALWDALHVLEESRPQDFQGRPSSSRGYSWGRHLHIEPKGPRTKRWTNPGSPTDGSDPSVRTEGPRRRSSSDGPVK